MQHLGRCAVMASTVFSVLALGQSKSSLPSKDEIFELLSKANEKISGFEEAVRTVRPVLDKIDPKLSKNYLDAASTAHLLIKKMNANGPSAYRLVGLLATIDDLSRQAANASVFLLMNNPSQGSVPFVMTLTASGTACNDIAELIMHATLRFIQAEEEIINSLPGSK